MNEINANAGGLVARWSVLKTDLKKLPVATLFEVYFQEQQHSLIP